MTSSVHNGIDDSHGVITTQSSASDVMEPSPFTAIVNTSPSQIHSQNMTQDGLRTVSTALDANLSSMISPVSTTAPSSEDQYSIDTSFSRTRTIIAVVVAILIFFMIITLLLCVGFRGRRNSNGEHELQTTSAGNRTSPWVLQSPLPSHSRRRGSFHTGQQSSWYQSSFTPFSQAYPNTNPDSPSQLLQRARDRFPRLPLLTGAFFPEVFPVSYSPSDARVSNPNHVNGRVEAAARPAHPSGIYDPNLPNYNRFLVSNSTSDGTPVAPFATHDPRHLDATTSVRAP